MRKNKKQAKNEFYLHMVQIYCACLGFLARYANAATMKTCMMRLSCEDDIAMHPEKKPHQNLSATSRQVPRHKAVLRIQSLMAEHDIRFVTDLWKLLTANGVEISHAQLTRVVNNSTKSLSIDLLEALATLFDCPVSSLFKDV